MKLTVVMGIDSGSRPERSRGTPFAPPVPDIELLLRGAVGALAGMESVDESKSCGMLLRASFEGDNVEDRGCADTGEDAADED